MTEIFLEREFAPPLGRGDVYAMAERAGSCFALHRVGWECSFLAADGSRMLCWFRAPDTESARIALRQVGEDARVLWPGTVHDAPAPGSDDFTTANVLVERSFPAPVTLGDVQAIEDAAAWCLEAHRVRFVRTFFANHRRRMICLYRAPDAESVRLAQHQVAMPVDRVWSFERLDPPR